MKIRTVVLSSLIIIIVLSMGYKASPAGSQTNEPSLKIGIVSIWKIFQNSQRIATYRQQTMVEKQQIQMKLDQLNREVAAEEQELKTLKTGSRDYLKLYKGLLEKRARLQAEQKFYSESIGADEQRITRELYKDILQATHEVAKQKGLTLVFESSEPELEALNPTQLEFAMGTHKLLYSSGCTDITDEVTARVDTNKNKK
ncbi:MAG: OmpH/Skp family outer membrane protein [Planctomycetota bacterium]|jgi:Skp family chaperone for outer membrane proteins